MLDKVLCKERGHKNIDGAVISALMTHGIKEWCHSPTLIQHTGERSTLNNGNNKKAPIFYGEQFNAMTFAVRKE
jgi:hypothetical protein